MPRNWWTRKNLVLAATVVTLTCAVSFVAMGLAYPEPVPSSALGPNCSRVKHTQAAAPVRQAGIAACPRLRT
jgi:hypothetical protein